MTTTGIPILISAAFNAAPHECYQLVLLDRLPIQHFTSMSLDRQTTLLPDLLTGEERLHSAAE